jgi:hypothetical protein
MKPLNCRFDCPGCLMTFDPDPETCPIEVFDGWEVGKDLDQEQFDIIQNRKAEKGEKS